MWKSLVILLAACSVDPNTLDACGDHCHAFPATQVAEDVTPHLRVTSPGFVCVPDRDIEHGSYYAAPCVSVFGSEGRCLATCIPEVGKSAVLLTKASCRDGEVCAPCFSPLSGTPTGACSIGDDRPGAFSVDAGADQR